MGGEYALLFGPVYDSEIARQFVTDNLTGDVEALFESFDLTCDPFEFFR